MLAGIISNILMIAGLELLVTDYDVTLLDTVAATPAGHDGVSSDTWHGAFRQQRCLC